MIELALILQGVGLGLAAWLFLRLSKSLFDLQNRLSELTLEVAQTQRISKKAYDELFKQIRSIDTSLCSAIKEWRNDE